MLEVKKPQELVLKTKLIQDYKVICSVSQWREHVCSHSIQKNAVPKFTGTYSAFKK